MENFQVKKLQKSTLVSFTKKETNLCQFMLYKIASILMPIKEILQLKESQKKLENILISNRKKLMSPPLQFKKDKQIHLSNVLNLLLTK